FQAKRVAGLLSCTYQKSSTIQPIKGTKPISCHHPLRSISCKRRADTAMFGNNNTNDSSCAKRSLNMPNTKAASTLNSIHHQNSERAARPLKSAYFLKQVRIDSVNVMMLPSSG